jgi:hypothetical protein
VEHKNILKLNKNVKEGAKYHEFLRKFKGLKQTEV